MQSPFNPWPNSLTTVFPSSAATSASDRSAPARQVFQIVLLSKTPPRKYVLTPNTNACQTCFQRWLSWNTRVCCLFTLLELFHTNIYLWLFEPALLTFGSLGTDGNTTKGRVELVWRCELPSGLRYSILLSTETSKTYERLYIRRLELTCADHVYVIFVFCLGLLKILRMYIKALTILEYVLHRVTWQKKYMTTIFKYLKCRLLLLPHERMYEYANILQCQTLYAQRSSNIPLQEQKEKHITDWREAATIRERRI